MLHQVAQLTEDVKTQRSVNKAITTKFLTLEKKFNDERTARLDAEQRLLKVAAPAALSASKATGSLDELVRMQTQLNEVRHRAQQSVYK